MADSDIAISVDNLSKSYLVGHESARGEGYQTLRDTLVRSVRNFGRTALDMARGRQIIQGDEIEEFWALKDVSFEVKRGEVVGIIGRNGAGKSTILKILSRITEPTRGRATIRGRIASLLEVGTGFHPELTGRENIYLNGAILGMRKREIKAKFDEIVAFAEVENFLDTPVKRYSSGMYVRLAFSVAAHMEPEILIVDEVLAVGDAAFQEKCIGKMNDVSHQGGRTVIFVSHNMSVIQHLCSRAILLKTGTLVADATPGEVVGQYISDVQHGGNIALTDWSDRVTTGEARITKLEIGGDGQNIVAFGQPLKFTIHAVFRDPVVDPTFGLIIHDAIGNPITNLQSRHDGMRIGKASGEIVVEGTVAEVLLYPGRYLLSPWISDTGISRDIDFPRMCAYLDVVAMPGPFGDLKLDSHWGKFFMSAHWQTQAV